MVKISMRIFMRNTSEYMERVKKGETFLIMKRNEPIANIIPHKPHQHKSEIPGWSTAMPSLKIKGLSMSEELVKLRANERS